VVKSYSVLGVISIIIIASSLLFIGVMLLPVTAGAGGFPTGGGQPQLPPPQVCDVNLFLGGKWKEQFPNPSTIREFNVNTSIADCKDARFGDLFGIFNTPFLANIFPTTFTIYAELADESGVVRYSSEQLKFDVSAFSLEHTFNEKVVIKGVLEGQYELRIFSSIGFDDTSSTMPVFKTITVPP